MEWLGVLFDFEGWAKRGPLMTRECLLCSAKRAFKLCHISPNKIFKYFQESYKFFLLELSETFN